MLLFYELTLYRIKTDNDCFNQSNSNIQYIRCNQENIIFSNDLGQINIHYSQLILLGYSNTDDQHDYDSAEALVIYSLRNKHKKWKIENLLATGCSVKTPHIINNHSLLVNDYIYLKDITNTTIYLGNQSNYQLRVNLYDFPNSDNNMLKKKRLCKPQNTELIDKKIEKCSICLDFINNPAYTDSCKHLHCFDCIVKQSKYDSKCPLCKKEYSYIKYIDNKNKEKQKKIKKIQLKDSIRDYIYDTSDMSLVEAQYVDYSCDYCMVCGFDNDTDMLLICDLCKYNVCHTYCDKLSEFPSNDWLCMTCRKS